MNYLTRTLRDGATGKCGRVLTRFQGCYVAARPKETFTVYFVRFDGEPRGRNVVATEIGTSKRYEVVED